ncbi:MAG: hypothetical protein QM778_18660 [Myxococcales bacterium]
MAEFISKLIELTTDNFKAHVGERALFVLSCLVSLGCAAWIGFATPRERRSEVWRAWVGFWIGTGLYYLLELVLGLGRTPAWWISQLALDMASLSLFVGLLYRTDPPRTSETWLTVAVVALMVVRWIDIALVHNALPYAFFHQAVDVVLLAAWAWKGSSSDEARWRFAGYALLQVPVPALTAWLFGSVEEAQANLFNLVVQCLVAKPLLLAAALKIVTA